MSESRVISLDKLIERTGVTKEQLGQECTEEHLTAISESIVAYRRYGPSLGLQNEQIEAIEKNPAYFYSLKDKAAAVFREWLRLNPEKATYLALVNVALKLKDGTGAEKICKICAEGVPKGDTKDTEETDGSGSEPHPKSPAKVKKTSPVARPEDQDASAQPKQENAKGDSKPPSRQQPEGESSPQNHSAPWIKELQRYCMEVEDELKQVDCDIKVPHAAPGSARLHLLWDYTQIKELKVHFLNPEVLQQEEWKCGGDEPLTASQILSWATVWNKHDQNYPKILDEKATKEKAHIRVLFTRSQKCTSWSKVGVAATWVHNKNEPTMVLNLYGMTKPAQRSMVIHEFGHALGLDHEHQRSDFWDVLEEKDSEGYLYIIDKEKMKNGDEGNCLPACEAIFRANLKAPLKSEKTRYDQDSIMHYWFDINWLLPEWRTLRFIKRAGNLTEPQRRVLVGVHTRDYHNGQLPTDPSPLDFKALNKAYSSLQGN